PGLNLGIALDTAWLEFGRGEWNSQCRGEIRRYWEEHQWRRRLSGPILTLRRESVGSTAARLKLKGIDGGPHKRWSMWFNSTQRAEPYQPLTWDVWASETGFFSSAGFHTGAAWLSSARVVRCWVKSRNERNPYL